MFLDDLEMTKINLAELQKDSDYNLEGMVLIRESELNALISAHESMLKELERLQKTKFFQSSLDEVINHVRSKFE